MAIVRSTNTTGAKSNTTLSGNISLEQGSNEMVSYTTVNGAKIVTYKIDENGIHYYDTTGKEIARYSADGVHYYNASGSEILRISPSGMTFYNDYGVAISTISVNGFEYYDTNGVKRISTGASSTGMMRMLFYDGDGTPRTIIGQNPNGGDQVTATSIPGHNVETELSS